MYVRWQTRKRKQANHLAAVLVENVWIKGRPVQQHIAYLGGVTGNAVENRQQFWAKVNSRLDRLANRVTNDERAAIVASIAAKVPPPTEEEIVQQGDEMMDMA